MVLPACPRGPPCTTQNLGTGSVGHAAGFTLRRRKAAPCKSPQHAGVRGTVLVSGLDRLPWLHADSRPRGWGAGGRHSGTQ